MYTALTESTIKLFTNLASIKPHLGLVRLDQAPIIEKGPGRD